MMKTMIWDQVSWITCPCSVFWVDVCSSTTGCARTQDQLCSLHLFKCTNEATNEVAKSKHEAVGWPLKLDSGEPWSTISAQILIQIDDALSITNFDIN